MKKIVFAALGVLAFPVTASAQDAPSDRSTGLGPYVGILGGGDVYDHRSEFGSNGRHGIMDGFLISGVAGVDVPLGPIVVGGEGNVAKGTNDIDWEYGVKGRLGVRAGKTGLIFASAGYEWVNGYTSRGFPHRSDWIYGGGVELGPKDTGIGNPDSGLRLRMQVDTYDFHSVRPMVGILYRM